MFVGEEIVSLGPGDDRALQPLHDGARGDPRRSIRAIRQDRSPTSQPGTIPLAPDDQLRHEQRVRLAQARMRMVQHGKDGPGQEIESVGIERDAVRSSVYPGEQVRCLAISNTPLVARRAGSPASGARVERDPEGGFRRVVRWGCLSCREG